MADRCDILLCRCAYAGLIPPAAAGAVVTALRQAGRNVREVPDLCELAARRDPLLAEFVSGAAAAADGSPRAIVACFPRAVRALVAAGANLPEQTKLVNLRDWPVARVLDVLGLASLTAFGDAPAAEATVAALPPPAWMPWFPAIDRALCRNCGQCVGFCMFGVYEMDEDGRPQVVRPEKCKTNCPACARVCPHAAIIFPKYGEPPINGDDVRPEDLSRQKMKVDLKQAIGDDPLATLTRRRLQQVADAGKMPATRAEKDPTK